MNAIVSQVVNSNSAQLYQEQVVQYLDVIDGVVYNPNLEGAQFLYRFLLRAMTNLSFLNPVVVKDMFLVWFQLDLGKTDTVTTSPGSSIKLFNFPALLMIALKEVERFPIKTSFHWKLLIAICNGLREELNDDETLLIQQPLFGYILHYLLVPQLQLDMQNIDANNANPISPLAFVLPKETHPVSGWLVYYIAPPLLNVPKSRGFKMRRYLSQYRHIIKNLKQKLQLEPIQEQQQPQDQQQPQEQQQPQPADPSQITQLLFDDTNAAWLYAHQPEMFDDEILVKKATATATATARARATITEDSNVTYIFEDEQNQDEEEDVNDDDVNDDDVNDDDVNDDDEAVLINDEMDGNEPNQTTRGWFSWLAWN